MNGCLCPLFLKYLLFCLYLITTTFLFLPSFSTVPETLAPEIVGDPIFKSLPSKESKISSKEILSPSFLPFIFSTFTESPEATLYCLPPVFIIQKLFGDDLTTFLGGVFFTAFLATFLIVFVGITSPFYIIKKQNQAPWRAISCYYKLDKEYALAIFFINPGPSYIIPVISPTRSAPRRNLVSASSDDIMPPTPIIVNLFPYFSRVFFMSPSESSRQGAPESPPIYLFGTVSPFLIYE